MIPTVPPRFWKVIISILKLRLYLPPKFPLHAGGMNAILKPLAKAEINILYLYTTINRIGKETIVILGVDKLEEAREILTENWIHLIDDEIYSIP